MATRGQSADVSQNEGKPSLVDIAEEAPVTGTTRVLLRMSRRG